MEESTTYQEIIEKGLEKGRLEEARGLLLRQARKRLGARDLEDWPILASALALGCPIWTEDTDFFGCGVATWTSNRIEIFLSG